MPIIETNPCFCLGLDSNVFSCALPTFHTGPDGRRSRSQQRDGLSHTHPHSASLEEATIFAPDPEDLLAAVQRRAHGPAMRTPASSGRVAPAASSRELLASELAEAQSALAALRARLRGTKEATAELRRRCASEEAEGPRRLRSAEEKAAEHCQTNHELRQLQHALLQVG